MFSGMVSMTSALTCCELAARMPASGSTYRYIYSSFGELPAWLTGWSLNLRYGASAGALARGWSHYCVELFKIFGISLPMYLYHLEIFGYVS